MTDDGYTETEAAVLAQIQTRFNDDGLRSAFREIDLSNLNANTYEFEVPVDEDPSKPVPEGDEMPRTGLDYQKKSITFDKFGFEITDDADDDQIEEKVDMMYAAITSQAANELYDSVRVSWASNDNRLDIVQDAIVEARTTVMDEDLVVVPQILGESIAEDDPTRDWDEIQESISGEFGVRVVTDQYNVLRGSDVLVVNTDKLGYEATRTYPETRSYIEYEEHDPRWPETQIPEEERKVKQEVVQGYMRVGYAVLTHDAGNVVRFGRV